MSCHDIGRALNNAVRETVTLLDDDSISKEAAKKIIACCRHSVNWCDGNEYEAVAYIRGCMCGNCLKKVPKGKGLYSIYDIRYGSMNDQDLSRIDQDLASDRLCEECFDRIVDKQCGDKTNGALERKRISANDPSGERSISTGEYRKDNNGCRW